jgi:hypothetical protein
MPGATGILTELDHPLILTDVITPGVAGCMLMMIEHRLEHLFSGPDIDGTLAAAQD